MPFGDFIFSDDFPNIMGSFSQPTGLTGSNLQFTQAEFDQLEALTGVYDPTSPDLTAYQAQGGKIIFWQGWADSGASPYMLLNYYNALGQQMGASARDGFTKTYMTPGAPHCGANKDLFSPLLNWVEQSQTPAQVNVTGIRQGARDRPVFPYPSLTVYNPATDGYVQGDPRRTRISTHGVASRTTRQVTRRGVARKAPPIPKSIFGRCLADQTGPTHPEMLKARRGQLASPPVFAIASCSRVMPRSKHPGSSGRVVTPAIFTTRSTGPITESVRQSPDPCASRQFALTIAAGWLSAGSSAAWVRTTMPRRKRYAT